MGGLSRRRRALPAPVFGCLEETGCGLAFRRPDKPGRRYVPLSETALADLVMQGWDRRLDPEPHCMAYVTDRSGSPVVVTVEYVEPHHNID